MTVAEAEGLGLPGSVCERGGRSHGQVISAEEPHERNLRTSRSLE